MSDESRKLPLIRETAVKSVITKSNLPVCEYSVNPYVGCTHGCRYCYASFMKRFTGHQEPWGNFLDVKMWPEIRNPEKYAGAHIAPAANRGIKNSTSPGKQRSRQHENRGSESQDT